MSQHRTARIRLLLCFLLLMAYPLFAHFVQAETTLEDSRNLLQQSLTIHEIDVEVGRLNEQEKALQTKIADTEIQIDEQQKLVDQVRKQSAQILRAYYMGERSSLIQLFFSSKNLQEALSAFEFIRTIMASDDRKLNAYKRAYEQLTDMLASYKQTEQELTDVKQAFLDQRARLVALQNQLDQELAQRQQEEAERIKQQMVALTTEWDQLGKPLFQKYLSNLSLSFQNLPGLITDMPELLQQEKGSIVRFQMTDQQFNDFLRSQNSMFHNIVISFKQDQMIVEGGENDLRILLSGHYTLVVEPENVVQFYIDQLVYNGYELPDTTAKNMEQQFDLGFNPENMIAGLEATQVKISDGLLQIWFKFDLSQLFG